MSRTLLRSSLLAVAALAAVACSKHKASGGVTPTLVFGPPTATPIGLNGATGFVVMDIDADGVLDGVAAHEVSGMLTVLRSLTTPTQIPVGAAGAVVAVGDIDFDRRPDLISASAALGTLAITRATASGFAAPVMATMADGARQILLADLNGDGGLDLAVAHTTAAQVSVLLGTGLGGFGATRVVNLPGVALGMVSADVNFDDRPDLVIATAGQVHVLLQQPGGVGFGAPRISDVAGLTGRLAVADIDGDGDTDILAIGQGGTAIVTLANDGAGSFTVLPAYGLPLVATDLRGADLDIDGNADVVMTAGTQVLAAYGLGAAAGGGFGPLQSLGAAATAVGQPTLLDVDADGAIDVVFVIGGENVGQLRNPRIQPTGLRPYGSGTSGCRGRLGLTGNSRPTLGNSTFHLVCSNAPANALGYQILGGPIDETGTDLYGIGLKLHIGTGLVESKLMLSNASGQAYNRERITTFPEILSVPVFAQMLWWEGANRCSASTIGVVSSRGLHITIQQP